MTVRRSAQLTIGLLCVAVIAFVLLPRSESQKPAEGASHTATVRQAGLVPAEAMAMAESGGHPPRLAKTAPVAHPATSADLHMDLGETAMLEVRRSGTRLAEAGLRPRRIITASVSNGRNPERPLEVHEDGDGREVPFTPHGPGEFNVVLIADGVPTRSHESASSAPRAGSVDAVVDGYVDPLLGRDPRDFHTRAGGRRSTGGRASVVRFAGPRKVASPTMKLRAARLRRCFSRRLFTS